MPAQARCASCTQPRTEPPVYECPQALWAVDVYVWNMESAISTAHADDCRNIPSEILARRDFRVARTYERMKLGGAISHTVCSCTRLQSIVPTHRHTCPDLPCSKSERSAFSPIGSTHMKCATARRRHALCAIDPPRCSGQDKGLFPRRS